MHSDWWGSRGIGVEAISNGWADVVGEARKSSTRMIVNLAGEAAPVSADRRTVAIDGNRRAGGQYAAVWLYNEARCQPRLQRKRPRRCRRRRHRHRCPSDHQGRRRALHCLRRRRRRPLRLELLQRRRIRLAVVSTRSMSDTCVLCANNALPPVCPPSLLPSDLMSPQV